MHASNAPRMAVGILHCPSWAATGRTLEQAYAAFANEVAARVATAKHLPPLSVRLFAFEPLEQHAEEDRAVGGSRGLENLIVFPHGGIAEVRAHVHTMFCDLAAEAIMALESWVLSATPEVVSLLTPLDLLDVATTAAAAAPAPAATTYDEPFEAVSENESNITRQKAPMYSTTSTATNTSTAATAATATAATTSTTTATTSSTAATATSQSTTAQIAHSTLDDRERIILRHGRLRKSIGDVCLMVGSPLDALEHYETSAELSRQVGDTCWQAAALEGRACAILLAHHLGIAIDDSEDDADGGTVALAARMPGVHGTPARWAAPSDGVLEQVDQLVVTTEAEADAIKQARVEISGMLREAATLLGAHAARCSSARVPWLEAELRHGLYLAGCPPVRAELGAGSSATARAAERERQRAELSLAVARCEQSMDALGSEMDRVQARTILASLCLAASRPERQAVHLSAAATGGSSLLRTAPRTAAHALRSALDNLQQSPSPPRHGSAARAPLWPSAEAAALASMLSITRNAGEWTEAARCALQLLRFHATRVPANVQREAVEALGAIGDDGAAPELLDGFGPPHVRFVAVGASRGVTVSPVNPASFQRAATACAKERKRRGEEMGEGSVPKSDGSAFLVDRRRKASSGEDNNPTASLLAAAFAASLTTSHGKSSPRVALDADGHASVVAGAYWLLDEIVAVEVEVVNECLVALPLSSISLWVEAVDSAAATSLSEDSTESGWYTYFDPIPSLPPDAALRADAKAMRLTLRGVPRRRWLGDEPSPTAPSNVPAACFAVRGLVVSLPSGASWRVPLEPSRRNKAIALGAWKRRHIPPPAPRKGATVSTEIPTAPIPAFESHAVVTFPELPLLRVGIDLAGAPRVLPPPPGDGPLPAYVLFEGEEVAATVRAINASPVRQRDVAYVSLSVLETSNPAMLDEISVSLESDISSNWHDKLPLRPGGELTCSATIVAGQSRGEPRDVGFALDYVGWLEPSTARIGRRSEGALRISVVPGIEVSHARLTVETKAGHHHEQQQEEEETIEVTAEAQVTNRIAAHAVEVAGAAGELPPGGSCWVNLVLRARRELVTSAAAERGKQKDRFTNELRGEVQSQLALEWSLALDIAGMPRNAPVGTAVVVSRDHDAPVRRGRALTTRSCVLEAMNVLFEHL